MPAAETHANDERCAAGDDGDVLHVAVVAPKPEAPPRLRCRVRQDQRGMGNGDSRLQ